MKINSNFKLFAATNFDANKYIASPAFGVNRFMLDRIGSEKARATTIVQYKPNSKFPKHTHIGGEEFLVLEGTFKDDYGNFPQGTYVRNPIDSQHAPWVDGDGCTIMVKLLQMADTGEGTEPLHVDLEKAKNKDGVTTDFGTVVDLYHNDVTGELVQMYWMNPSAVIPTDEAATSCGEELFVMDGSLDLNGEEYTKWGWLRFPVASTKDRLKLQAGDKGAQVYRKTGHLTEKALGMEKIQITEDDTAEESRKRESPEKAEGEPEAKKTAVEKDNNNALTLKELSSRFPSLPLENPSAPFLGLYFSAAWCPDCVAATPAVGDFCAANTSDVKVMYVASESSEEEMKAFCPSSMGVVPFDNQEERADLKRHFGACAAKEREPLGMTPEERKHGIPTLVILDTATGKIVTADGVNDIEKSNGDSVVEKWKAMRK